MTKLDEPIAEAVALTKAAQAARARVGDLRKLSLPGGKYVEILPTNVDVIFYVGCNSVRIQSVLKTAEWLKSLGFTIEEPITP